MNDLRTFLSSINEQQILVEGVKFGEKEINDILSRSSDFNIGIEYEIRPTIDQRVELEQQLKNRGLMNAVDKILPEHDEMTEVITKKLSLKSALKHINGMFSFLSEENIEVPEMAGMHISISTNKYSLDDFNAVKFFLLLDSDYIHRIFPAREHVVNIAHTIKNNIDMIVRTMPQWEEGSFKNNITTSKIKDLEKRLEDDLQGKYQTANIKDYHLRDGRIELRFFGGENYHDLYDNIKQQLLRSLFIMELGYTDLYKKEYYKEIYNVIKNLDQYEKSNQEDIKSNRNKLLDAIREEDAEQIYKIMNYWDLGFDVTRTPPKLFKKVLDIMLRHANDELLIFFASMVNKDIPAIKERIKNNPELASAYAISVMGERFYEVEKDILKDSDAAGRYLSRFFSDQRLPKDLEQYLADNVDILYTWSRYLYRLNASGVLKKENFSKLPKPNIDAIISSLTTLNESNIFKYIDYKIIDDQNINDILRVYTSRADDKIEASVIITLLRDYKNYYDIDGAVVTDSELRKGLLNKSHVFHSYLGTLSTEEKLIYVDGLIDEYAVFMDNDENKIAERIGSVIEKRQDGNLITDPLKPINDEFINAFNKKYNTDIK